MTLHELGYMLIGVGIATTAALLCVGGLLNRMKRVKTASELPVSIKKLLCEISMGDNTSTTHIEINHLCEVLELKHKHGDTWRDKSEGYWLARLIGRTYDLAMCLQGAAAWAPDVELAIIASICLNWLEMRRLRQLVDDLDTTYNVAVGLQVRNAEGEIVGTFAVDDEPAGFTKLGET